MIKTTYSFAASVVLGMFAAANAFSDIVLFDFSGATGDQASQSASFVEPNASAASLVRGLGVNASGAVNSISASGWSTGALDPDDYFGFSVTSNIGTIMDLTALSFAERRSGTGIRDFEVRSSTDGFATFSSQSLFNVPDNTSTRNVDVTLSGLTGLAGGTTVEFRIYGFNAEGSGGTWRIANHSTLGGMLLDGSISVVPEPTAIGILALLTGYRSCSPLTTRLIPDTACSRRCS